MQGEATLLLRREPRGTRGCNHGVLLVLLPKRPRCPTAGSVVPLPARSRFVGPASVDLLERVTELNISWASTWPSGRESQASPAAEMATILPSILLMTKPRPCRDHVEAPSRSAVGRTRPRGPYGKPLTLPPPPAPGSRCRAGAAPEAGSLKPPELGGGAGAIIITTISAGIIGGPANAPPPPVPAPPVAAGAAHHRPHGATCPFRVPGVSAPKPLAIPGSPGCDDLGPRHYRRSPSCPWRASSPIIGPRPGRPSWGPLAYGTTWAAEKGPRAARGEAGPAAPPPPQPSPELTPPRLSPGSRS